jgi:hypothetical protein
VLTAVVVALIAMACAGVLFVVYALFVAAADGPSAVETAVVQARLDAAFDAADRVAS